MTVLVSEYTATGPPSGPPAATFTYDGNGNLTGDGTNTYTYDVENRLVGRASNVTLRYDPLGRLYEVTGASGTTRFLYDGDALVAEYVGGALTARYVHGTDAADDPLIWYDATGTRHWLHRDHQGSITGITDGAGAIQSINAYDEYGIPRLNSAGQNLNAGRFQYTGQAWLAELGMYHYKARIYSPTLGRFLQTDPVGYDDQFNLYAYVGNDPVNNTDSTGQSIDPPTTCGSRLGVSASCSGQSILNITGGGRGPRAYGDGGRGSHGTSTLPPCETHIECWRLRNNQDYGEGRISREEYGDRGNAITNGGLIGIGIGAALFVGAEVVGAIGARWLFSAFKAVPRWATQMRARGWTPRQITEAIRHGRQYPAANNINPANGATRYVHRSTGQSVVRDNVTGEIIHIGGPGFRY